MSSRWGILKKLIYTSFKYKINEQDYVFPISPFLYLYLHYSLSFKYIISQNKKNDEMNFMYLVCLKKMIEFGMCFMIRWESCQPKQKWLLGQIRLELRCLGMEITSWAFKATLSTPKTFSPTLLTVWSSENLSRYSQLTNIHHLIFSNLLFFL